MLISIIIPVFNEEKTVKKILKKINELDFWDKQGLNKEIIVVDDKSVDETRKILEGNSALYSKLITNNENMGKGYSVKKGLEVSKGDYVLIQDADEEYDPEDYIKFLKCVKEFDADLVIGSRFFLR